MPATPRHPARSRSSSAGRVVMVLLGTSIVILGALWFFQSKKPAHEAEKRESPSIGAAAAPPPGNVASSNNLNPAAIIAALAQTDLGHGPLTAAQADVWHRNLQQLSHLKTAAVPALQQFLEKNQDLVFDNEADRQATGCSSLRRALLDVLEGNSGPEAETAALAVLQRTADPTEIATLSRFLDRIAPGKHAQPAIAAARETLKLAASPGWDGRDIAPLLEVLKHFAGPAAVPDLQQASATWFDYAPIVLADLPEGAGVPALIQWTKNPNAPLMAGNDLYLRMLAEVSVRSKEALTGLLELAQANRIPSSAWDGIAAGLSGMRIRLAQRFFDPPSPLPPPPGIRSFHISAGNQSFVEIPADSTATAAQFADRAQAVERLLAATDNPFGQQALQKAKQTLGKPPGKGGSPAQP